MSNSTLSKLFEEQNAIIERLLETGGEVTTELESMMTLVDQAIPEKVDGYKHVMDRLESETEYFNSRAQEFAVAAKVLDNARERMKDHLKRTLQEQGLKELVGNDFCFKLSNTKKSVVISNQELIPKEYIVTKTTETPDKARILADLELGVPVAGASAVEGFALKASINKSSHKKLKGA